MVPEKHARAAGAPLTRSSTPKLVGAERRAGWQIHDYLDYNEPREVLLARRRAREARRQGNRGRFDASR